MKRFYFILLFQIWLVVPSFGREQFFERHEYFIEKHESADTLELLDFIKAQEKSANAELSKNRNDKIETTLAFEWGVYYHMTGQYEDCISSFEEAIKLNAFSSDLDQALMFIYLGFSYGVLTEDYEKMHECFDSGILKATKIQNLDLIASATIKKAYTCMYEGSMLKSIPLLESLNTPQFSSLSIDRQISLHSALKEVYEYTGSFAKAYAEQIILIKLAEQTNDELNVLDQQYNMAALFIYQERYAEALPYLINSLPQLLGNPKFKENLNMHYGALAVTYAGLGELDSAIYYITPTLDYYKSIDDKEGVVIYYNTMAVIHNDKSQYNMALHYIEEAIKIEEESKWVRDFSLLHYDKGAILYELERYEESIRSFKKSNLAANQEGNIENLYLGYTTLSLCYEETGELKQALVMKDSAFYFYDSLQTVSEMEELYRLETQYETQLKEQEIVILKGEVRKEKLETAIQKKETRDLILFSILSILSMGAVIYLLFARNQLKKVKISEAQSQIQNQKLEADLLFEKLGRFSDRMESQDKMIEKLKERVTNTKSINDDSLLSKVTLEKDWLNFMVAFDKVYDDYLKKLKEKNTKLTVNNLRLAAMVKLELSNKEIANILNITENGVKKAKQRLKEKLMV